MVTVLVAERLGIGVTVALVADGVDIGFVAALHHGGLRFVRRDCHLSDSLNRPTLTGPQEFAARTAFDRPVRRDVIVPKILRSLELCRSFLRYPFHDSKGTKERISVSTFFLNRVSRNTQGAGAWYKAGLMYKPQPFKVDSAVISDSNQFDSKAAAARAAIQADPNRTDLEIASSLGVSRALVNQQRRKVLITDGPGGEAETWGRLISSHIPLKMQVKVLKDLLQSQNPVAAGRAMELILESRGLRKKISEPSRSASIVVQANDDTGFD